MLRLKTGGGLWREPYIIQGSEITIDHPDHPFTQIASTSHLVLGHFLLPKKQASWFQMLCWRFLARALCEVTVSGQFNSEFERVKRSCADLALQMRCPYHFKNPTVEVEGESFDDFSMEIFTCCGEFRRRVEEALDKLVTYKV